MEPSSPSPSSSQSEPIASGITQDDDLESWIGPYEEEGTVSPCVSENDLELLVTANASAISKGPIIGPRRQKLVRRKSSPTLTMSKSDDEDVDEEELKRPSTPVLYRSGSYKEHEYHSQEKSPVDTKTKSRTAWGKVKEYIHTRKDSLKKRPRKKQQDSENRKSMTDAIFRSSGDNISADGEQQERPLSRSLEASMDTADLSGQVSPCLPRSKKDEAQPVLSSGMVPSRTVDLSALMSGMSEEFTKKMQEWEEKKTVSTRDALLSRSGSFPENLASRNSSSEPTLTEDFVQDDDWEGLHTSHTSVGFHSSDSFKHSKAETATTSSGSTPRESTTVPPGALEDLSRSMSDSFNRKLQEWERMRYRGGEGGSGGSGAGGGGGGSSGSSIAASMDIAGGFDKMPQARTRQKSDKKKTDKEKSRLEKVREKELMKVEREKVKLEKEKQRLERERQRTIKREAELERKKEQLEDYGVDVHHLQQIHQHHIQYPSLDTDGRYKFVNVGEYTVEGISEEFAKKLQEWEVRIGQRKEHEPSQQNESLHLLTDDLSAKTRADAVSVHPARPTESNIILPPTFKEGQVPLPIVIKTHHGVPEQIGSIQPLPQTVRVDPTYQKADQTVHETQTTPKKTTDEGTSPESSVFTYPTVLEYQEANVQLRQQLRQRESDYRNLQDDLEGLNRALRRMNESYTKEISSYKRQLWASSNWGNVSNQSKFIADAVTELRHRVDQLEELYRHQDALTSSLSQAKPSTKPKDSTETPGNLSLVEYLSKLFSQIQDLRNGILERNQLIDDIHKQLSWQEVTNLLLNADVQRRSIELQMFKKKHKHGVPRRHCTFGGQDFCLRKGCGQEHVDQALMDEAKRLSAATKSCNPVKRLKHGHFDPQADVEPDMPDILRHCGICFEPAATERDGNGNHILGRSPESVRQSPTTTGHVGSPREEKKEGRRGIRVPIHGNKEISISVKCKSPRRKLERQGECSTSPPPSRHYTYNQDSRSESPHFDHSGTEPKQKYVTAVSVSPVPHDIKHSQQTVPNQQVDLENGAKVKSPASSSGETPVRKLSPQSKRDEHKQSARQRYERSWTSPLYPPRGEDDGSHTRCSSISSGSDVSSDKSTFKVRSASYFSPKPYGKAAFFGDEGDSKESSPQRQPGQFYLPATPPLPKPSHTRQIGPLRKLRSATEILYGGSGSRSAPQSDYRSIKRGFERESDGVSPDVERVARSFRLETTQSAPNQSDSNSQVKDMIRRLSTIDDPGLSASDGQAKLQESVKSRQQGGMVKKLSEAFDSSGCPSSRDGSRSPTDSSHLERKMSLEVPPEGMVNKRLQEFSPATGAASHKSVEPLGSWLDNWKWSRTIPKEGTVQKRLEEFGYGGVRSDSRASSRMSSVSREPERDECVKNGAKSLETYEATENKQLPSKDVKPEQGRIEDGAKLQPSVAEKSESALSDILPSASLEDASTTVPIKAVSKGPQAVAIPIKAVSKAPQAATQSSIFLRTPKSQKLSQKHLSPIDLLVRDTLTLNLMDTEGDTQNPQEPEMPRTKDGTEATDRRKDKKGWFSRGFFKSTKS